MRRIDRVIVHHSASLLSTTFEEIEHWHRDERGWSAIGYHYVIEVEGTVFTGRRLQSVGAHAKGHNAHSVGICLVGDNTVPARRWTVDQREALGDLVGWLRLPAFGHGHLEGTATACPGLTPAELEEMLR